MRRVPARVAMRITHPENLPRMTTHTPAPPADSSHAARTRLLITLSLIALYFIWGSTYFAIRIGLEGYPPFLMAALRFLGAGSVLYAFLRWRGMPAPSRPQWLNAAFSGTLLLGLGNGLVCYAEQSVSSGLAAVAVASMPLFAAMFGAMRGQWPRQIEWIGLGIGFSGVILLNLGGSMSGTWTGTLALIVAPAAWAYGSVWSRQRDMPRGSMNTAAQMLTGGAVLLIGALLFGERWPANPSLNSSLAIVYLAVMGSLVAFSAYLFLLNTVRPALATSYAYVNPPVAVLIGAIALGEVVHTLDIVAMAVILAGVALITLMPQRKS